MLVLGTLPRPAICQPGVGHRFLDQSTRLEENANKNPDYCSLSEKIDSDINVDCSGAGIHPSEFYAVFQKLGTNWYVVFFITTIVFCSPVAGR